MWIGEEGCCLGGGGVGAVRAWEGQSGDEGRVPCTRAGVLMGISKGNIRSISLTSWCMWIGEEGCCLGGGGKGLCGRGRGSRGMRAGCRAQGQGRYWG